MKIFELNQNEQAMLVKQVERFIDDKIYVIESWEDYDNLPQKIKDARKSLQEIQF